MTSQADKAARFLDLHHQQRPLLMPNPWDAGTAKLLAAAGFQALATTSSGYAATLGRLDHSVTRGEALAHAAAIVDATDVPISADLENAFADDPDEVAATIAGALKAGLAGCSVEDSTGDDHDPIYPVDLAASRIEAAARAAHEGPVHLVLTARAENYLHGRPDLTDTIERLRAYHAAGADVLFAPGLSEPEEIGMLVNSVGAPVNVLVRANAPTVQELAALGVSRISVGGSLAFASLAALAEAARELAEDGTYGFFDQAARGIKAARDAFAGP